MNMGRVNAMMRALESAEQESKMEAAITTLVTAYYLEFSDATELDYAFTQPLFKLWDVLWRSDEDLEELIEQAEKEASAVVGRVVHTPREAS